MLSRPALRFYYWPEGLWRADHPRGAVGRCHCFTGLERTKDRPAITIACQRSEAEDRLADDSDVALHDIQERLVDTNMVQRGEYVVVLAGQPFFAQGSTNFIKVERVA